MKEYLGIDYGHGKTNIDSETGIRYGVIHHSTVGTNWYDEAEMDFINPEKELEQAIAEKDSESMLAWFADHGIEEIFEENTEFEEIYEILLDKYNNCTEPLGFYIDKDGIKAYQGADSPEIFVTKSPFYTYGQFCSPCAPGAINLDHPVEEQNPNNRAYCLDSSWFEDEKAPYRVFRILD